MTPSVPLIAMHGVRKEHGGAVPLRIETLVADAPDRYVLSGLDAAAAETFFHLISGAALPDEGTVLVAGADTRAIATDTEWLLSLDRFGFMTHRAVLLETLDVAANLALPMTLAVDPMPPDVRAKVVALAAEVDVPAEQLDRPVKALDPLLRARLHLGRALGSAPRFLLLEHPTSGLADDGQRAAFGRTLSTLADRRGLGWIALSDDRPFARASGGTHYRLETATGAMAPVRRWWPWNRS